jgi:hypothetical protein
MAPLLQPNLFNHVTEDAGCKEDPVPFFGYSCGCAWGIWHEGPRMDRPRLLASMLHPATPLRKDPAVGRTPPLDPREALTS